MTTAAQAFKPASAQALNMDGMPSGTLRIDKNLDHAELKGLPELPYLFGMAFYADVVSPKLYALFYDYALKKAMVHGWKGERYVLRKASQVALDMHLYPQVYSLCRTCGGSGSQRGVHMGKDCKSCSGTRFKPMPWSKIATTLGIDKSNMNRTWKSRVDYLYKAAADYHSVIYRHVNKDNGDE